MWAYWLLGSPLLPLNFLLFVQVFAPSVTWNKLSICLETSSQSRLKSISDSLPLEKFPISTDNCFFIYPRQWTHDISSSLTKVFVAISVFLEDCELLEGRGHVLLKLPFLLFSTGLPQKTWSLPLRCFCTGLYCPLPPPRPPSFIWGCVLLHGSSEMKSGQSWTVL